MRAERLVLALLLPIAGSELVAPAVRADDVPPEAVVGELPFESSAEPNRIVVNLAPEGSRPFPLMLDTGANQSSLTPGAARALGIAVRRTKSSEYRRGTRLGRDLLFWVDTDSSDTGSRTGWEHGLLGGNFLAEFVIELDFAERRVRFLDPKHYTVPAATQAAMEQVLPLRIAGNRPALEIHLGGKPVSVMLDTGTHESAILSGAAARKAGIDVAALPDLGSVSTLLGPMQVRFHEAPELAIGDARFARVPLLVAPRGWYNQAGTSDSVIGYDLISRFLVRIDYPRKRIWLKRERDAVTFFGTEWEPMREAGAVLAPEPDAWQAIFVLPGSAAARLGLRAGDRLLARDARGRPAALDDVVASIRAGRRMPVSRLVGEAWVDLELPAAVDAGE